MSLSNKPLNISLSIYQGAPIKLTKFYIEITLEIFGLGDQFRYLSEAAIFSYLVRQWLSTVNIPVRTGDSLKYWFIL